jgi:hypothetical protein
VALAAAWLAAPLAGAPSTRERAGRLFAAEGAPRDTISALETLVRDAGPGGDAARAAEGIRAIVSSREPLAATPWIHLLAMLARIEPASAPVAIRAVALADAGNPSGGADALLGGLGSAAEGDRGSLLALAALLAEEADPTRAAELRVRVMEEAPEAIEVPEIKLRHARWLLSIEARREEGFRLAEDLIVEGPDHPIAPEARRLLQVERARDAGRPTGPSSSGPPVPNRR